MGNAPEQDTTLANATKIHAFNVAHDYDLDNDTEYDQEEALCRIHADDPMNKWAD